MSAFLTSFHNYMTAVQLHEIQQSFAGHPVLRGLSLSIESGRYVVLLGPSGCGKTTTLRVIAGLQSPAQGTVQLDGRCVAGVAPRDRDVAMVFQHDGLYPHLTVEQSIRFALRGKIPPPEIRSRVDQAIELTKTSSLLNRYPGELSGGELRRAAIAKAIARRTSIRLLDEPLSALDAPLRHALQDDILRWHATVPGTTIHVTHDGQEALRMADKIAVMEAGQITQFAAADNVFMKPQTVSVARAIGAPPINLIPACLTNGAIDCGDSAISVTQRWANPLPAGDVIVGVRPDALCLAGTGRGDDDVAASAAIVVRGELLRSKQMPRDTHIYLRSGGNEILAVIPRPSWQSRAAEVGDSVQLFAERQDVHLFDAVNQQRIECER